MQYLARLVSTVLFAFIALAAGCDCAGPVSPTGGPGSPCTSTAECRAGLTCRDDTCQMPSDGSLGDGGMRDAAACPAEDRCVMGILCCAEGEECVDDFACAPVCPNERCGDNGLVCCDAGQICLDGVVCAASCDAGRTLCGADLDVCCAAGEVCVEDACVAPGAACMDDYDCLTEGTYCEATIGSCLPNPRPPLCEVRPDFSEVSLEIEWHWAGVTVGGTLYANTITSPVVGDVTDDGIPEVIIPAYAGASLDTSVLVAINGRTGETIWSVSGTNGGTSQGTPALANLDPSDDALEIAYVARDAALVVLDGDGTTQLARFASATTAGHASPSIHDIDRDGDAEIIVGARAFAFEPAPAVSASRSASSSMRTSATCPARTPSSRTSTRIPRSRSRAAAWSTTPTARASGPPPRLRSSSAMRRSPISTSTARPRS